MYTLQQQKPSLSGDEKLIDLFRKDVCSWTRVLTQMAAEGVDTGRHPLPALHFLSTACRPAPLVIMEGFTCFTELQKRFIEVCISRISTPTLLLRIKVFLRK
jgi:hypothetical protein